ncbi:MAG TPA: hypothetical protein PLX50_04030 [Candidatus Aminicenantes bacterium]|nr:hypothetical protein [Candidatus Aminicenantes bacterium]
MKAKHIFVASLILAMVFLSASCDRSEVTEPNPLGPSTFATLLKVSSSPNVLFAGTSRGSTVISATLKKYDGTALSNRTVYFEICDAFGSKLNLGFFEGNEAVKTKTTDGSGGVAVTYYGPLYTELTQNTSVYIWVRSAMDGNEFIYEFARLDIIADLSDIAFKVQAYPNVIYATAARPTSEVIATVKLGAKPLVGQKVYFEVLPAYPGFFTGNFRTTYALTDANGLAKVTYHGPTKSEINWDIGVWLRGQLETNTTKAPETMVVEDIYIRVIRQP